MAVSWVDALVIVTDSSSSSVLKDATAVSAIINQVNKVWLQNSYYAWRQETSTF